MRSRKRNTAKSTAGRAPARRSSLAAVASLLPLAVSMIPSSAPTSKPSPHHAVAVPLEFTIPMGNLRDWAKTVVTTLDGVKVEGHSAVHPLGQDCEMHLGAHTPAFRGNPDGLVLEPMNACVEALPGKPPGQQNNADWTAFGDQLVKESGAAPLTVSGVPRIWPEHLDGGTASNPDHAVELHPLTSVITQGQPVNFAVDVFAGDYHGGVGKETALNIVQKTDVTVARNGDTADVGFSFNAPGHIGNFTVLDIIIDRDSIANDGAGSFRMDGDVVVDGSTSVPVRIVTVKDSPINADMPKIKSGPQASVSMEALVLFSLSPEALLAAANKSGGDAVVVDRPIQLILYGSPDS